MTPEELAAALIAREEMPPEKGDIGPQGPPGPAVTPAIFLDPATATPADIVNALIAAGLMAGKVDTSD